MNARNLVCSRAWTKQLCMFGMIILWHVNKSRDISGDYLVTTTVTVLTYVL